LNTPEDIVAARRNLPPPDRLGADDPHDSTASRHWMVVPEFFGAVDEMRRAYDARFSDPMALSSDRFVWDYWHIPDMFTYLRALPQVVFSKQLLCSFMTRLRAWGNERLACRNVYLPLLNCHIHDCWHNLHSDAEKGPWAYVFSLTNWDTREFSGGETLILNPDGLDQWKASPGMTNTAVYFSAVAPRYNQLTVFDARLPHSVRRVEGPRDPRKGRVALAGWFTDPGTVTSSTVEREGNVSHFETCKIEIQAILNGFNDVAGMLVVHLRVAADGVVEVAEITVNSLVHSRAGTLVPHTIVDRVRRHLLDRRFPPMPDGAWASIAIELPHAIVSGQ
jgi:hypothetical protein